MKKIELLKKKISLNNIIFFLFLILPISILSGNLLINITILSISLIFFLTIILKKIKFNYKNKIFILLIFFFISLIINLIFSDNYLLSYPRVIKFFFIIFFIFSFRYLILNTKYETLNKIYKFWFIVFSVVIFDLIFEYIIGHNILGYKSSMPNIRLASFTGIESIIGNYFYGFSLIFLAYLYKKFPNKKFLNLSIAYFLIIISFLIGERSNFIKTFIIILLFSFLVYEVRFKYKILSILFICFFVVSFLNFNEGYKVRYFDQINKIFEKNGIKSYLDNSQYGAHYNVAGEIFKNNPVFGVGIKNFRVESSKKKYEKLKHKYNKIRGNTHPHQIHYEFLSETGSFGYLCFLLFIFFSIFWSIKSYLNNKNIYQIAAILFVASSILPLIPSGSFFSTYSSSIFWINYAIMTGYINYKNN
tara:strand:- start:548 stop:1801 length:1254 start_codon:yes stop_codon:yes gene_type:complete